MQPDINPMEILALPINELWTLYKSSYLQMIQDKFIEPEQYKKIRFGFNIKFEIDDYIEGNFRRKLKSKEIVIFREVYNIQDFRTEIEFREREMRMPLMEYYGTEERDVKPLR